MNCGQETRVQALEKIMIEVIRVTWTALGSGTRTGKYIFCVYSFSCDFPVQLCVFVRGHCMAMLRGVECVRCEEVLQ